TTSPPTALPIRPPPAHHDPEYGGTASPFHAAAASPRGTKDSFTNRVNRIHPGACLEWVLTDHGQPHLVDYSLTATCAAPKTAIGGRVLSAGRAQGPVLAVADGPALERLSIAPIVSIGHTANVPDDETITALRARIANLPTKPILYASRPYVILSQVIDDIAGMVFDGGSALCHLAILLREAQLPAIVAPGFDIDRLG
ncbi:PEP-utilizing enzyme, partial [Acrocarpospora sp. B8E8]|uniref:PEP-utilizing enzyme n=1 Tax=Acrocarpospora sp. B8E8 TaxID=3153572 RepID=UPI00325C719C